ncbi:hypothetical protein RIF29_24241 [Crotalaria pallida]|uniref:C2 domain-containing protein n=1 Tax=Crotalaria pallida TaxID=3830 RepID=A0AAN9EJF1_CROPI
MSAIVSPFQLLEINIISAQDLVPVTKSVNAYAIAWLKPERKLATKIDQVGHTNPTWNEKFLFRVDEEFLKSESSVIMIEIYTTAWLRDILIGTVGVLISNLLPSSARSGNRKSKLHFVALQIRRPSGRPQGILNIGVTLLDNTMRSMPMYSELSTSAVGYWDIIESKKNKKSKKIHGDNNNSNASAKENHGNTEHDQSEESQFDSKLLTLQRCQSERNDYSSISGYSYYKHYGFDGQSSEVGAITRKGSVMNTANANNHNAESLCSDVGPSPSLVVAAAMVKGLYTVPIPPHMGESSGFDEWTENNSTEGMKTKMERWRNEFTPVYDDLDTEIIKKLRQTPKRISSQQRRRNGLCSCFGTVFGCEISITCGGGNRRKKIGGGKGRVTNASDLTEDHQYFI